MNEADDGDEKADDDDQKERKGRRKSFQEYDVESSGCSSEDDESLYLGKQELSSQQYETVEGDGHGRSNTEADSFQPLSDDYSTPSQSDFSRESTHSFDSPDNFSRARIREKNGDVEISTGRLDRLCIPAKSWFVEVWQNLTLSNARKCGTEMKLSFENLLRAKDTWTMCLQYLLFGLSLSLICEIIQHGSQYNVALIIALMAGFEMKHFPSNSVRPQLVLSLLVAMSFILDIILFSSRRANAAAKVLTSISFMTKGLALYNFLCLSNTGDRAKKYLWRRLRVFAIPLSYPRKPMREIRARVLAIEWMQGGVALGYVIVFIFGFSTIGVADVMSSPSAGMPLVAFLPIKFLSSSAILLLLIVDTDVTLCLAYFGCLGGFMSYVKAYIHSKHQEYGGWPLSYAMNPYRIYAVAFMKFIDVCFGFAGWAAVGTTFAEYYSLGYNVMAIVSATVTLLVFSDIWVPVLFFCLIRMIQRHEYLVKMLREAEESDDSELDELDIRNNEKAIKEGRRMRQRREASGFLKPIKTRSSADSVSSSDSEVESDENRQDEEIGLSHRSDEKYEGEGVSLNINLDMALGSEEGNMSDDELDTYGSPDRVKRSQDTLVSPDKYLEDQSQASHFAHPGSQVAPPGPSWHTKRSLNAVRLPPIADDEVDRLSPAVPKLDLSSLSPPMGNSSSPYYLKSKNQTPVPTHERRSIHNIKQNNEFSNESYGIILEENTSISPDRYTEMWDDMEVAASFSAELHAESGTCDEKLVELVHHLQSEKFYVVAAGETHRVITIYGFASGFKKMMGSSEVSVLDDSMRLGVSSVYFLMELKINTDPERNSEGKWHFECSCKCNLHEACPFFIRMMLLGDCLQLIK